MASYEVIQDQVTIPKKIGDRLGANKKKVDLNQHIVYRLGQVIDEKDISPKVLKRYKDGDESILRQIELVEDSEKSE